MYINKIIQRRGDPLAIFFSEEVLDLLSKTNTGVFLRQNNVIPDINCVLYRLCILCSAIFCIYKQIYTGVDVQFSITNTLVFSTVLAKP